MMWHPGKYDSKNESRHFSRQDYYQKSIQWLFVLALLVMSTVAWSRTDEAVPRYDIVDMNVALRPAAAPRKSLQFKLLPTMGTPQVQLIAPKAAGTLAVRALAVAPRCGCTHIEGSVCAWSAAEVAKIEMTIRGFFEALRRDDKVAFQPYDTFLLFIRRW